MANRGIIFGRSAKWENSKFAFCETSGSGLMPVGSAVFAAKAIAKKIHD